MITPVFTEALSAEIEWIDSLSQEAATDVPLPQNSIEYYYYFKMEVCSNPQKNVQTEADERSGRVTWDTAMSANLQICRKQRAEFL